ncbi:MAG: DNA adenine methylase [Gemmatimonadota bacterium]
MRYLGNKTRLVPFLLGAVERIGIRPGVACDPFAGTASVGRALKRAGWQVHCGDLMALSYALQVARVELDRSPRFPSSLLPDGRPARGRVGYPTFLRRLGHLPPGDGFLAANFAPSENGSGREGRMYFTPANARRIDAIRDRIGRWTAEGALDRPRVQLLLATLILAADRVANTTGVYASYVKTWQPNARRPLDLRPIHPTRPPSGAAGPGTAFRGDARDLVARVGTIDLLYLDPPYNQRQYPAYYHVPELLAVGWDPPPLLRGKTGLIPDGDRRSAWCRSGACEEALRDLLDAADARHVLLSYNDEGLMPPGRIEEILRARAEADSYRRFTRPYRRYRSDADGPGRTYVRDRVREALHYVRC